MGNSAKVIQNNLLQICFPNLICYDNTTTAIRKDLKGYEFHASGSDRFDTCYFE